MTNVETEICIVGDGLAGLTAAAALAAAGFDCHVVGPGAAQADDLRTTAMMLETVSLLRGCGVWGGVGSDANQLERMRIVDGSQTAAFDAAEIGAPALAWNARNATLKTAARAAAEASGAVFTQGCAIGAQRQRDAIDIRLGAGGRIRADFVIAADGEGSRLRDAAGIAAQRWDYDLSALTFTVDGEFAAGVESVERYRPDGSITTVPTGDHMSIVWIAKPNVAAARAALDDVALASAAADAIDGELGALRVVGARSVYPLRGLHARRYGRSGVALVGESAHRVSPLGSQGFNLTARDILSLRAVLLDAQARGARLADPKTLARYDRARRPDVTSRIFAVNALTRFVGAEAGGALARLRGVGLGLLGGPAGALRRSLMREGIEPRLARFA